MKRIFLSTVEQVTINIKSRVAKETYWNKRMETDEIFHQYNKIIIYTLVILINTTQQFWYALQNPQWRSK